MCYLIVSQSTPFVMDELLSLIKYVVALIEEWNFDASDCCWNVVECVS